jgi:SAM-dependent methyltransferase
MTVERNVIEHYRHGALEEALLRGLSAVGKDLNRLTVEDLAPADEFHIGGRQATIDFAADFEPAADTDWLDIGSGLGGASRYVAHQYKCRVTGVDLSEEYVAVAGSLAQRVRGRLVRRHRRCFPLIQNGGSPLRFAFRRLRDIRRRYRLCRHGRRCAGRRGLPGRGGARLGLFR